MGSLTNGYEMNTNMGRYIKNYKHDHTNEYKNNDIKGKKEILQCNYTWQY